MTTNFNEFALNPALQTSLKAMNFETPTPIQVMAIPPALAGRDILGSAQTGTGKTAAFCVPMLNYLLENPMAHALVMLPTRELATQVHDVARKMIGQERGIKTALLIGGEPIGKQYAQLDRRPRLIVGTPGRINDHLRSNPDLVDRVSFVVLDEADRMLDMGFSVQIDTILSETALERQTLMFSATFPDSIIKFSKTYLNNPERVSIGVQSKPGDNIVQESLQVNQERKYDELQLQLSKREGSVIIFVRTKHGADKLAEKLSRDEHRAEALHGGLRQRQRDKVIQSFRKNNIRIMVATDVAARGLDVPHIEHVINFDLPQVAEDYIHRIGRTARAGAKGHSVSFISPSERGLWRDIERMLDPNVKNPEEGREGGRKFGGKPSGGKKFGSGKPYGPKKESKYPPRKPFGRADRKERKEGGWNPDGDFQHSNDRPRRDFGDRPQRLESNQRRPFKKEDDFASNPESYKRTNSGDRKEGGFKKPFRSKTEGGGERSEGFKKPYSRSAHTSSDRPRSNDRPAYRTDGRSDAPREGFKKPYNRDGVSSDRSRSSEGRPSFRKEGSSEGRNGNGGFKKPFSKDRASKPRSESNNGGGVRKRSY